MMKRILFKAFSTKPYCDVLRRSTASKSSLAQAVVENAPQDVPQMPSFDYSPPPYAGPSADEILAKRRRFVNPAVFHLYRKPLTLVEGKMQYLFNESNRRYLNAFGGIATVSCGHSHPEVVDTIVNQTKLLQHCTNLYLNPVVADFAEVLACKFPGASRALRNPTPDASPLFIPNKSMASTLSYNNPKQKPIPLKLL